MFGNVYQHKTVLVTGHTGFKGAWLSAWLLDLGATVNGYSNGVPSGNSLFQQLDLQRRTGHFEGDIRDLEALKNVLAATKPDFIFHLAAQPIVKTAYLDPIGTLSANVMGTANLLEAVRVSGIETTIVLATSDKAYDNLEWPFGYRETDSLGGKDPYSASKGAAELVIKAFYHSYFQPGSKVRLAVGRSGNVIGGGDWADHRIVPDCARAWSQGQPAVIRSPRSTRPWQHVLEPLSGYLRCAELLVKNPRLSGEPFNFGPAAEQNAQVIELVSELGKHWDFRPGQPTIVVEEDASFHESGLLKLNCDKALQLLGWKPTLDFGQTAAFTGSWYNRFFNQPGSDMAGFTRSQINDFTQAAIQKNIGWTA